MATFFPRNVIKKLIESYILLSFSHFDSHVNLYKHYGAPKFRENKMLTWLDLSGFESDYYEKSRTDWLSFSDRRKL